MIQKVYFFIILIQQLKNMQKTLATVNINMGWGKQNPSLIITRATDVPSMVASFIQSYHLPHTAYDVIMEAIQKELTKENISLETLGRPSYDKQNRVPLIGKKQMKENIQRGQFKYKKQTVSWDQLKTKKQVPINRIQFQKKNTSPVLPQKYHEREQVRKQEPKLTKITLARAKSPVLKRQKSNCQTKRTISPVQRRTPLRERQLTQQQKYQTSTVERQRQRQRQRQKTQEIELLQKMFERLIRNQPKSIKVLSPQYVSFNGIKPEILAVLQDFFQQVEEYEFMNMDKSYFIGKLRQLGLNKKLVQTLKEWHFQ